MLTCTGGVKSVTDRRAAVLVEGGLGVGEFLAEVHGRLLDDVEGSRLINRRQEEVARAQLGVRVRGAPHNRIEGQLRGGADECLQFLGRADTWDLDEDSVDPLALDRRFAGADLIDPAADDFQRLLDRAGVGGCPFGVGQAHGQDVARPRGLDIVLGKARQRDGRVGERTDKLQRARHAGGFGYPHPQLVFRAVLAPDRPDGVAFDAQGIAHFGPERVHALGIDVFKLDLGQKMRTAPKVEAKVHQRARKEAGPACGRCLAVGVRAQNLDLGPGIVGLFDPAIKEVGRREGEPEDDGQPDGDPLPALDLKHGPAPWLSFRRVRFSSAPGRRCS